MLTEGERFLKSPAIVRKFLANLPVYDAKERYIVMKPVHEVEDGEDVRSIVFVAKADQIAALSTLANYRTGISGRVIVTAPVLPGARRWAYARMPRERAVRPAP